MKLTVRVLGLLFCLSVLVMTSCKEKVVSGDKDIISEEIPVDIYNEIKAGGAMDIYYEAKPDEAAYLRVEADENIIPLLSIEVKKNKLIVKAKESIQPSRFVIYTNSPTLKQVEGKGASNIHIKGEVSGKQLKVEMEGTGNLEAAGLDFEKAEFYLKGNGDIQIQGQAEKGKMKIQGNGDFDAFDFIVGDLECQLEGNGNMSVNAVDKLSIEIKGNGNVIYTGTPQITKQKIKGQGVVKQK